jgi:outer membrane receptor protein involved in Fe transport
LPITRFKAHPAYENSGEIPTGGRGSLGRTPVTHQVDVKVDYVHSLTEKTRVRFALDVFNLFNQRQVTLFDQNEDITVGLANADFLKPLSFQRPRYARVMVKFEF